MCAICGMLVKPENDDLICEHCREYNGYYISGFMAWSAGNNKEPECVHYYQLPMAAGQEYIQLCKKCGWCSWVSVRESLPSYYGRKLMETKDAAPWTVRRRGSRTPSDKDD